MPTIVVADDDRAIRESLRRALSLAGYDVVSASNGNEVLRALDSNTVDLLVLDVTMPELDGVATTKLIRAQGRPEPILMLTARTELSDRIAGLDAGADDYLAKPFDLPELQARIRALLRRPAQVSSGAESPLVVGPVALYPLAREVTLHGETIPLTRTEFDLLQLLMSHENEVLSAPRIYEEIWGYDFGPSSKNLAVYIRYLRKKLEPEGSPKLIYNKRGSGYVIRTP